MHTAKMQWRPELRLTLRRPATWVALLFLMLAGSAAVSWHERYHQPQVIVVQPDAVMHHGPLDESPSLQTLRDGQELTVLDSKDDWLQAAGAARGIGWIKRDLVVPLPP